MGTETLPLSGVSFALLEKQRLTLATIKPEQLTPEQMQAVEGIQNMLDAWSDEVYFRDKAAGRINPADEVKDDPFYAPYHKII